MFAASQPAPSSRCQHIMFLRPPRWMVALPRWELDSDPPNIPKVVRSRDDLKREHASFTCHLVPQKRGRRFAFSEHLTSLPFPSSKDSSLQLGASWLVASVHPLRFSKNVAFDKTVLVHDMVRRTTRLVFREASFELNSSILERFSAPLMTRTSDCSLSYTLRESVMTQPGTRLTCPSGSPRSADPCKSSLY